VRRPAVTVTKPIFPELRLTWRRFLQDCRTQFYQTLTMLTVVTSRRADGCGLHIRRYVLQRKVR